MSLVLSLFPGIGLLDMAFEEPGFCVVRGPDVLWGGDIRRFHPPARMFDGVIGGPPCQTFSSLANLVRAQGRETRFGNLIPEFERCVSEAVPRWFLMENVPAAPVPVVRGYGVTGFLLCNSEVPGEDGKGQEQMRKRLFSFGMRGRAVDLRWYIRRASELLPLATETQGGSPSNGERVGAAVRHADWSLSVEEKRTRTSAVLADVRDTPVALGGSGKRKRTAAVRSGRGLGPTGDYERERRPERRTLAEMCRLQGLPEDFLADAPFTADGKRKAVANGVPLPMGRAIAAAVVAALRGDEAKAQSGGTHD